MFPKTQTPIARGWKNGLPLADIPREKKIPKRIPPISKKKTERLKENGSETEFFMKIWDSRPHKCEKCGHPLAVPKPHNFDHKVPKSAGEKYRYDESNIQILCFACHFEKTTGLKYKGINLD